MGLSGNIATLPSESRFGLNGVTCCLQKRFCCDKFTDVESYQVEIDYHVHSAWLESASFPQNFKLFLASQRVLLSGDVTLNPGPLSRESFSPSERLRFGNERFSSLDSESDAGAWLSCNQFNTSEGARFSDDFEPPLYFNLDLPSKGPKTGMLTDHLTSSEFDQIKSFFKNRDRIPQVDVLMM